MEAEGNLWVSEKPNGLILSITETFASGSRAVSVGLLLVCYTFVGKIRGKNEVIFLFLLNLFNNKYFLNYFSSVYTISLKNRATPPNKNRYNWCGTAAMHVPHPTATALSGLFFFICLNSKSNHKSQSDLFLFG